MSHSWVYVVLTHTDKYLVKVPEADQHLARQKVQNVFDAVYADEDMTTGVQCDIQSVTAGIDNDEDNQDHYVDYPIFVEMLRGYDKAVREKFFDEIGDSFEELQPMLDFQISYFDLVEAADALVQNLEDADEHGPSSLLDAECTEETVFDEKGNLWYSDVYELRKAIDRSLEAIENAGFCMEESRFVNDLEKEKRENREKREAQDDSKEDPIA